MWAGHEIMTLIETRVITVRQETELPFVYSAHPQTILIKYARFHENILNDRKDMIGLETMTAIKTRTVTL